MKKRIAKAALGLLLSCCMTGTSFGAFPAGAFLQASAEEYVGSDNYYDYGGYFEAGPAGDCIYTIFTRNPDGTYYYQEHPNFIEWDSVDELDYYIVRPVYTKSSLDDLDKVFIKYDADIKLSGSGYSGVTLTQQNEEGLVVSEFQIIENRNKWEPAGTVEFCGHIIISGKNYDMYKTKKDYIETNGAVHEIDLYMLVCMDSEEKENNSPVETVYLKDYISAWAEKGVEFNNICNYGLFVHGSGSGSADIKQLGDSDIKSMNLVGENPYIEKPQSTLPYYYYDPYGEDQTHASDTVMKNGWISNYRYTLSAERKDYGKIDIDYSNPEAIHMEWTDIDKMEYCLLHDYGYVPYTYIDDYDYSMNVKIKGNVFYGITVRTCDMDHITNAEYQIIEGWGTWRPSGNAQKMGEIESDGKKYELYKTQKEFRESDGTERTIDLYMAIIADSEAHEEMGRVSIVDHLNAWKELGEEISHVVSVGMFVDSQKSTGIITFKRVDGLQSEDVEDHTPYDTDVEEKGRIEHKNAKMDYHYKDLNNGITTEIWDAYNDGGIIEFRDHMFDGKNNEGFYCQWKSTHNSAFDKGYVFEKDDNISANRLESLNITYKADFHPDGNAYIGCYGWISGSPLSEFYIVDGWGDWKPAANTEYKGSFTSEGKIYDIYKGRLTLNEDASSFQKPKNGKKPISTGPIPNRYWSVCRTNQYDKNSSAPMTGSINVADHFKAWRKAGLELGYLSEIYFGIESYDSSGYADITNLEFNNLTIADEAVPCDDIVITEPGQAAVPGDLNGDNIVNVFDVVICRGELVKKLNGDSYDPDCDVNGDDKVTVADVIALSQFVSGKIKSLTQSIDSNDMMQVGNIKYEEYKRLSQGITSIEANKDGTFSCRWDDVNDYQLTAWNYDTCSDHPAVLDYEAEAEMDGNVIFGVSGFTKMFFSRFYIVEGWNGYRPFDYVTPAGTVSIGDRVYDVYREKCIDENAASDDMDYYCYWSVARDNGFTSGDIKSASGEINIKDHVYVWAKYFSDTFTVPEEYFNVGLYLQAYDEGAGSLTVKKNTVKVDY